MQLAESGYRLRDLLRTIVMSDAFRTTSGPRPAEETPVTPTPATTPVGTAMPSPTAQSTDGTAPSPTPTGGDPNATPTRSPVPDPTATARGVPFQQLQDQIFTPRCATQFCHSQQARTGGLVLEAGEAFANLVGAQPTIMAARAAGMLRVDPFAPDNSFLILKLSAAEQQRLRLAHAAGRHSAQRSGDRLGPRLDSCRGQPLVLI